MSQLGTVLPLILALNVAHHLLAVDCQPIGNTTHICR
jgi:hypothetical protein